MDELTRPVATSSRGARWRGQAQTLADDFRRRYADRPGRSQESAVGADPARIIDWDGEERRIRSRFVAVAIVGALLLVAGLGLGFRHWLGRSEVPIDDQLPLLVDLPPEGEPVVDLASEQPSATPAVAAAAAEGGVAMESTATPVAGATPVAIVAEPPSATIVVHVAGEVRRPGLVTIERDARAWHAITEAGGPTADADLDRINLAAPVTDGQQLHVPGLGESEPPALVFPPPEPTTALSNPEPTPIPVVDINRDGEVALTRLPGIGPSLARAIVELRDARGPFFDVEELLDVAGIGPATLDRIRPHVVAGTP